MISAVLLASLLAAYAAVHLLAGHPFATKGWVMLLGAGLPIAYLLAPSVWLRAGLWAMALVLLLQAVAGRGLGRAQEIPMPALQLPFCLTGAALAVAASLH